MRFWYQNDLFKTEDHLVMLTYTNNHFLAWYHQKLDMAYQPEEPIWAVFALQDTILNDILK